MSKPQILAKKTFVTQNAAQFINSCCLIFTIAACFLSFNQNIYAQIKQVYGFATPVIDVGTNGVGLKAEYFDNADLTALKITRTDANINFWWGDGSPDSTIGNDTFSARWSGQVEAPVSGEYTFYINSDNGRRLWINDQLIIDAWVDDWNREYTGKITLNAGQRYNFKMEYFESFGGAGAKLEWSAPGLNREVTPQNRLFPTAQAVATPFGGTARAVPGKIEAEDFDEGGEDVAYHDWDASNNGGSNYRTGGVDVRGCFGDAGGGLQLGWVSGGEWLKYTLNVGSAGTYKVTFRVSSGANGGSLHLEDAAGNNLTGSLSFGNTGGWDTFANVTKAVNLPAGTQTYKLVFDSGALDFNYLNFESASSDRVFPADLIANVRDYGARGDGVTDDTAAIQQAICNNINRKIIYFPNGTYVVSNRLEGKYCDGNWANYLSIMGQNRNNVVIRLRDNAAGYSDSNNPRGVIFTASGNFAGGAPTQGHIDRGEGNEAFGNYVENLTVDTGNNAGAVGIDYLANNVAGVRDVSIRGNGRTGLAMTRALNGPLLIKNVSISGFAYGIVVSNAEYGVTLEHINISNITNNAIYNDGNIITIRDLTTNNIGSTVIKNPSEIGMIALVDATFNNGASGVTAIENPWDQNRYNFGALYLRNVTANGYGAIVREGDETIGGSYVSEHSSNGQASVFASKIGSLNLPVQEPPDFQDNNLSNWANVLDYGAVRGDWGDDSAAIQAAFDSGKSTIYFPSGVYQIGNTVRVRGNVRRVFARHATITVAWGAYHDGDNPKPMFRLEDGNASAVTFEGIGIDNHYQNHGDQPGLIGVEQATSRALFLKDFGCCNLNGIFKNAYRSANGAGSLFLENVTASRWNFGYPQNIWVRQFNPEGNNLHTVNNGANLWILGFKTEGTGTVIRTQNGGSTEVIGGLTLPLGILSNNEAAFESIDSRTSLVFTDNGYDWNRVFPTLVRETRNGVTKDLPHNTGKWRGYGRMTPLFVGAPAANGEVKTGEGVGLTGQYFDTPDFNNLKATRIDNTVNFDWKSWFTPIEQINHTSNYSIRWTGKVEVPVTGSYTFYSAGDYYAPLWVNGQQIVGTATFGGSGAIYLEAGRRYDIRLDFKGGGSSWVNLKYKGPGMDRAVVVPRSQLYPN